MHSCRRIIYGNWREREKAARPCTTPVYLQVAVISVSVCKHSMRTKVRRLRGESIIVCALQEGSSRASRSLSRQIKRHAVHSPCHLRTWYRPEPVQGLACRRRGRRASLDTECAPLPEEGYWFRWKRRLYRSPAGWHLPGTEFYHTLHPCVEHTHTLHESICMSAHGHARIKRS